VPVHPAHPDPEELAAWKAGDLSALGGARIEQHLAGCARCAGLVAAAERGRAALAELPEVDAPAGLHDRLLGAVERETGASVGAGGRDGQGADGRGDAEERRLAAAGAAADGQQGNRVAAADGDGVGESGPIAEPVPLDERRRRQPAQRRRIALLSAAAAVILLVAGLVPLLDHLGGRGGTGGGGAGTASEALSSSPEGALPVFAAPGDYSGTALRSALTGDPRVRSAYQRAASPPAAAQSGKPGTATPQFNSRTNSLEGDSGGATKGSGAETQRAPGGGDAATARSLQARALQQQTCVDSAQKQAGTQGLRPAFFVHPTTYKGRPATVLVTVRPGAPSQADLWAFPRGNCAAAPFAHEPVTVTPP
jgi:hypothetical protein